MTSKQRVLTIKISVTVSFLLWSSKGHEPKAPLHNTKIRCLLLPQLSSVSSPSTNFWNKIKCRQVSAVLQKWEKNYFLWIYQKLIIATFIPGTKYSEENLFLPRAQSERKKIYIARAFDIFERSSLGSWWNTDQSKVWHFIQTDFSWLDPHWWSRDMFKLK